MRSRENTFPLVDPVLVKFLLPDSQEALQRHGCSLRIYPNAKHPFGHMITFPEGVQVEPVTSIQSWLHFPDGYHATLIWSPYWYHLYPVREAAR